ncbi:MAG: hypothetical protein J7497_17680, partial [Chitinophagaceae bacterium]|nr:hypothetical protein [Chitinophagaceae bacterium]
MPKYLSYISATFLCIIIMITSCKDRQPAATLKTNAVTVISPTSDTAIKGNFSTESGLKFDSNAIAKFIEAKPLFKEFAQDFINFYRAQNYNYVWYNNKGLIQPALVLVSTLENVQQEGILTKIPYREEYMAIATPDDSKTKNATAGSDINTELLLTGEYFNYAKNVYTGAAGDKVKDWYLPRKKLSYDALLHDNIKADSFAAKESRIVAPQYLGLKKALALYREIEKKGHETLIPTLKKPSSLKTNDTGSIVPALRKRLYELKYTVTDTTSTRIDNDLITSINLFKKTNGLKADSIVNNSMIKQLNIPVHKRIEQILVNMERFRWIPPDGRSDEFILVNIPEYSLHYFENGKIAWECNVVTGSPMTKTVI